jgi:hypothetical protein
MQQYLEQTKNELRLRNYSQKCGPRRSAFLQYKINPPTGGLILFRLKFIQSLPLLDNNQTLPD